MAAKEKLMIYLPKGMKRTVKVYAAEADMSVSEAIELLITGALFGKEEILAKLKKGATK